MRICSSCLNYTLNRYLTFFTLSKCFFSELSPRFRILSLWNFELLIFLSSDIETNPGPKSSGTAAPASGFSNSVFSFCNWNVNTLSKNDFQRVSQLEVHNTFFQYDIISLCETSLNETTKVPENLLKGYQFISSDHPRGDKKGGVGFFYKETLPLKYRDDLSFEECIVVELRFGRKKIFFTVLYRNPINKHNSPEFLNFMHKFEDLHKKIKEEKTYTVFYTDDFNAHFFNWRLQGDNTNDGIELDKLMSNLNLSQIISEPTHFHEHCLPSCIDLIIIDQPNLVLNSGVRSSLDPILHVNTR